MEGACKSEERGLTRCRGGSQGTWEMHSSRCQSPHQAPRSGPTGPHHEVAGPESHRRDSGRRPSRSCGIASLDNPMRTGRSPPSRVTRMIEWWKNSSGTAKRIDDDEERKKRAMKRKKTRERLATKATPTSLACGDFTAAPSRVATDSACENASPKMERHPSDNGSLDNSK